MRRTFRRSRLEQGFVEFCQLSTETYGKALTLSQLQQLELAASQFIDSPDFASASAEREILGDEFLNQCAPEEVCQSHRLSNLPSHLAGLCEEQLLSADQERRLFQRMNFLRYRSNLIVDRWNSSTADQWDIERTQGLLRAANWHRDCLVKANVRLVISVVKRYVTPHCGFDELLSDGIMALIRAVDGFDYQLGFRFSTYATQVVRRSTFRYVIDRQEERLRFSNSLGEDGIDVAQDQVPSSMNQIRWDALQLRLRGLLGRLDRREKFIIRARFSLGGHRRVQTLQKLAERLQISKERVRQLEKRALEKLTSMANENPLEMEEFEG